jgi:hypothetical protein
MVGVATTATLIRDSRRGGKEGKKWGLHRGKIKKRPADKKKETM